MRRGFARAHIQLAITFIIIGCSAAPSESTSPRQRLADNVGAPLAAATVLPPMWASEADGVTESGAFYTLLLPQNWNGRLLLVVHGLIDPALPVAPAARTPAEDSAGAHGYGIAYSSFSENGWSVKDGAQRTHELRDLFTQAFGAPSHVYLYGQSMGGVIAVNLAESFPTQIDGVVSECGILGGPYSRFRYMIDTRLLFDYFYPNVLPGSTLNIPPGLNLMTAVRLPARAAMLSNMDGARKIAEITQTPIPFATDAELEASIEDQVVRHAREINDIVARGHGEFPVDRSTYTSASIDPALITEINAVLPHFVPGRYAQHYWTQYYEPTGALRIPVLSLYTDRDPALPAVLSDTVYSQRLLAAGTRSMFRRQAASVQYGHCTGTIPDRISALRALVTWAEGQAAPW